MESLGKKVTIEYCERVREIVSILAGEGGSVRERIQKSLYHLSHRLVSQVSTPVKSSVKNKKTCVKFLFCFINNEIKK